MSGSGATQRERSAGTESVEIARLGAQGDGIAADGTPVAGALPGERVEVRREGTGADLVAVETPSPERVAPFCPVYGACGGCRVQHLAPAPYAAWKAGLVAQALAQAGLDAPVEPLVDAHGAGRRRLTLHVRHDPERGAQAGLMAARSHRLVAIERCPITVPALHRAPEVARALSAPLGHGRKPLDVAVTASAEGLDVDVRGHGPAEAGTRAALVRLAGALGLARLSLHGETLVESARPSHASGGARLTPAPGGFLQATEAGEAALVALVLEALPARARRVADLFSGCGPFSLAMARGAQVRAVEGDAAALTGLDRAARAVPGLKGVATERRDLFRRPLLAAELDGLDAVVLDPPRAGAQAQVRQIAASKVPTVVSVSCDPGTFARDAATLAEGGYTLERITPVDQFRHAAHVEIVGRFRRASPRRR